MPVKQGHFNKIQVNFTPGYPWQSLARIDFFAEFPSAIASESPEKLRHRIHSPLLVAMPLQACRLISGSFWFGETGTRAFLQNLVYTKIKLYWCSANSNLHPFRPQWMELTLKCSYLSPWLRMDPSASTSPSWSPTFEALLCRHERCPAGTLGLLRLSSP